MVLKNFTKDVGAVSGTRTAKSGIVVTEIEGTSAGRLRAVGSADCDNRKPYSFTISKSSELSSSKDKPLESM